jgi:excisionase family DNA binding protein
MVGALEKELLSAEDVAVLMGVKETTVWRWCREERLPCLKVGKHWRVRRETFEDFLERSERSRTPYRRSSENTTSRTLVNKPSAQAQDTVRY